MKKLALIIVFLTSFLLFNPVLADAIDINNLTNEQLHHLTIEQLNSVKPDQLDNLSKEKLDQLPAIEILTKAVAEEKIPTTNPTFDARKEAIVTIEYFLGCLKFYTQNVTGVLNSALQEAIKTFQRSIKSVPTGILLVGEANILASHCEAVSPGKITPLGNDKVFVYSSSDGSYVSAQGVWDIKDEAKIYYPIRFAKITCEREKNACIESDANVRETYEPDTNNYYLEVNTKFYTVKKWDKNEVSANLSNGCIVDTLMINLNTKECYILESASSEQGCTNSDNIGQPKIIRMVKGFDGAKQYFENKEAHHLKYYNQEYMNAAKSFFKSP